MIRSAALGVILALTSSIPTASALDAVSNCCACPKSGQFALSGPATNATLALFCVATNNEDTAHAAAQRCHEQTGGLLECVVRVNDSASCHDDLLQNGILCPTSPAPAAGGTSLLALAVVLGAAGSLVLRRRRG